MFIQILLVLKMLVHHMGRNTCLTSLMTTRAWPGSILSRKNQTHQLFSLNGKLLSRMSLVNTSSCFVQTMGANSRLTLLLFTCVVKAFIIKPLHHTHPLRTASLNACTAL